MEIICLESEALQSLVEQVAEKVLEKHKLDSRLWIDREEAMELLRVKSTKLQELRDTGKIRFSKVTNKTILYHKGSLLEFIEQNARNTF